MTFQSPTRLALLAPLLFGLSACGDSEEPKDSKKGIEVPLAFRAVAGGEEVVFGEPNANISPDDSMTVTDLRFYVSNIQAIDADGQLHNASLNHRLWHHESGVALIDLSSVESGASTLGVNNHVVLGLPDLEYTGLKFTVGVPFELNHSEVSTAPAPFNMVSMNWSWRGGRLFFRLDASTGEGNGANVHVGSTGCQGEIDAITHCDQPNRIEVELAWSAGQNIELDLEALFAGLSVNNNTEQTGALCMASPDDADCAAPFSALGLPFGEVEASEQLVFMTTDADIELVSTELGHSAPSDHGHGGH